MEKPLLHAVLKHQRGIIVFSRRQQYQSKVRKKWAVRCAACKSVRNALLLLDFPTTCIHSDSIFTLRFVNFTCGENCSLSFWNWCPADQIDTLLFEFEDAKKNPVYCPQYWDRDCFCSKPNDDVDFHTKHHISPANFRTGLLDSNQSKNLISRIRIRLGFQCSSRAVSSLRSNVVFQSATVYSSLDGDMPKIENWAPYGRRPLLCNSFKSADKKPLIKESKERRHKI